MSNKRQHPSYTKTLEVTPPTAYRRLMKFTLRFLSLAVLLAAVITGAAFAHCQVPCGIYGDEIKFAELEQHVETIAKASKQIRELAAKESPTAHDIQQLVRWTDNKESHAAKIIDDAANYFLAQRIKPDAKDYAKKVELLHHIIVFSMKCKQNTDDANPITLGEKLAAFKTLYMAK